MYVGQPGKFSVACVTVGDLPNSPPGQNSQIITSLLSCHIGSVGSAPDLVGWMGSGVCVSASFHKISAAFCPAAKRWFPLRDCLCGDWGGVSFSTIKFY